MPETPDLPDGPYRKVRAAANKAAAAREGLSAAIRDAHKAGASLREIAEAAGMSHETVRKLVA